MPANLHPVAGLFELTLPRIHGSQELVDVVVDKTTGKKKVNGKSKALKRSGEYPLQFGLAIGSLLLPTGPPAPTVDKGSKMFQMNVR